MFHLFSTFVQLKITALCRDNSNTIANTKGIGLLNMMQLLTLYNKDVRVLKIKKVTTIEKTWWL